MHLSAEFGRTEFEVQADGFRADEALEWIGGESLSALDQAGRALSMVGHALERQRPEALVLVGDRFETAAAAMAATLKRVPLVHLHGGEETSGAVDNSFRHAITQMSQLHLVSHKAHAERVIAMGIDPAAVHVVGAPGLDNLHRKDLPSPAELENQLGLELRPPVVVVTLHPATAASTSPDEEAAALCSAMEDVAATYVITLPNTDPGHRSIREILQAAAKRPGRVAVEALGSRVYWALLRAADAMLGNSSSAVIEGSALGLPAVNVGERQRGRLRGDNLIDARADRAAISAALRTALSPETRQGLEGGPGLFGEGYSAARIMDILREWRAPFSSTADGLHRC
jgi:UDP-N-acetylglucosamine 2-epimerase (non-hydrolysing)